MTQYNELAEVGVEYARPVQGLTTGDLMELGAQLTKAGNAQTARAISALIQQAAASAAMSSLPRILEGIQESQRERLRSLAYQVQALPSMMGYVSRDVVLQIISNALVDGISA